MKIICARCGAEHLDAGMDSPTQGHGCAASVYKGQISGHYGSTVLDMEMRGLSEAASLPDGTDPVCDGCINALDAAGFLGEVASTLWAGPNIGREALATGRWISIAGMDDQERRELADALQEAFDRL